MTIIVGITNGTNVYMGGDRGTSDGIVVVPMYRPKIMIKDDYIFGYAGSPGTGQLMEMINFKSDYEDPYYNIRLNVVEQMKKAIDAFGVVSDDYDAQFLIGSKGRLFEFSTIDWSVIEIQESAVGSGNSISLGSLYTTKEDTYLDSITRVRIAVDAAIALSPSCSGPVDILWV